MDELRRCAGTQFDPRVVEAFTRVLEREMAGATNGAAAAHRSPVGSAV